MREIMKCEACDIPIATSDCPHLWFKDEYVIMSEKEWRKIADELQNLRTLEAVVEDARLEAKFND